jgi:hypothetical protein
VEPHDRSNTVEEYRYRWMGARRCSLDGLLTRSTAVCSCGVSIQCAFSWSLMHCVSGRKAAAFQQDAQADYETIFGNVRSTQGRWTLSKHWSYPVNNGGVRVVTERERARVHDSRWHHTRAGQCFSIASPTDVRSAFWTPWRASDAVSYDCFYSCRSKHPRS